MKLVKNFLFAAVLVSAIAINTPAGEQESPGIVKPPQPPNLMCTCDEYPPVDSTEQAGGETSDYLLYEALAALLSMY